MPLSQTASSQPSEMLYDDQATHFDERAGVPADACAAIAGALAEMVSLRPGQTVLEVGAGTGTLSLPLVRRPIRYVGFDRSPAMLDVFRARLAREGLQADLRVADGNGRWPAAAGSVDVIFSARAVHHLDAGHVVAETQRVARRQGCWLVLGQVRRPDDSVRAVLRRQMRRLLKARGYAGRNHQAHAGAVFAALERLGARRAAPCSAARWTATHRPADALNAWESKAGLAGLAVPAAVKAAVLADVRAWAAAHFGDLDEPLPQEEIFELSGVYLRGNSKSQIPNPR